MRPPISPSRALLLASVLMLAINCSGKEPIRLSYPAPAAFKQEPRPSLDPQVVIDDNEEGFRQHQRAKDEWGQRGWSALNDVCLWFKEQGAKDLPCMA